MLKIVLLGDIAVGKSSILLRIAVDNQDDKFEAKYNTTIFVDFKFGSEIINGKKVKMQIWDTSGQEKFASLSSIYFKGADLIIMTFDMTRPVV